MSSRLLRRSIGSRTIRVTNTLLIRGFGSTLTVLLTLLVTRHLETKAAAAFLLIFNLTTIAAICFRWGLDDVIVRRVAAMRTDQKLQGGSAALMQIAHRRVGWWLVAGLLVTLGYAGVAEVVRVQLEVRQVLVAVIISSLIALTACAGRVYQGLGYTNFAAFILNILVPGLLLIGLMVLLMQNSPLSSLQLQLLYVSVSAAAYVGVVWTNVRTRPRQYRGRGAEASDRSKSDRQAANKFGGIVLSQQALNWSALIIVPAAYGDLTFNSFMVTYKVALLLNMVMLAVNFTFASRLATLYVARESEQLSRLSKVMVSVVLGTSLVAAAIIGTGRTLVYQFADVPPLDAVLLIMTISQVFFALASVYGLILSMCHDETYLLKAQSLTIGGGMVAFTALCFVSPIEAAVCVFVAAYVILSLLLGWRTRVVTRKIGMLSNAN